MLGYELWEAQSGNLMASYDSEGEALAAVVARVERHGVESIHSVTLVQVDDADDDAEMVQIAHGVELLARAKAAVPAVRNGVTAPAGAPKSA